MAVTVEEVVELVRLQLGRGIVRRSDRLMEDLGADSADILNLIVAVEDRFGISIDEEDLARLATVDELARLVAARV